jgi:hypothetical protein
MAAIQGGVSFRTTMSTFVKNVPLDYYYYYCCYFELSFRNFPSSQRAYLVVKIKMSLKGCNMYGRISRRVTCGNFSQRWKGSNFLVGFPQVTYYSASTANSIR